MPAFLTHRSFALRLLGDNPDFARKAFLLGSQGPDPYFFYGQLPWKKREGGKEVAAFGSGLHHIDPAAYFASLLKEAGEAKSKSFTSYVYGLGAHYCLDRAAHPFVFGRTGFSDDRKLNGKLAHDHTLLEVLIDEAIATGDDTYTPYAYRYIDLDEKEAAGISAHLYQATAAYLGDRKIPGLGPSSLAAALDDYRAVLKITNKPRWFSKVFVDLAMGKESQVAALHYPSKAAREDLEIELSKNDFDLLNEEHFPWPDPFTGKERNESFLDLYEKAASDAEVLFGLFDRTLAGEKADLPAFTAGLTHDGGHVDERMAHFESIFRPLKQ